MAPKEQQLVQESLLSELRENNDFFDRIVEMMPYSGGNQTTNTTTTTTKQKKKDAVAVPFKGNTTARKSTKNDHPVAKKNPYHKGVKADSKEARKAATKLAKRRKIEGVAEQQHDETVVSAVDTNQDSTTMESSSLLQGSSQLRKAPHRREGTDTSRNEKQGLTVSKRNHINNDHGGVADQPKAKTTSKVDDTSAALNASANPPQVFSSRIEALRAKLHAKIAQQQNRPGGTDPDQVSKRAARRAEKERRRAEAKQRAQTKSTTVTTAGGKGRSSLETSNTAGSKDNDTDIAADLSQVDFGRLSGLNPKSTENYFEANKALANLRKTKNIKKMLDDAIAKKEKLELLKKGNAEEQAKATELLWADTLKEADGTRVKDDPKKLKKVLKRKEAKKAKSQKAWKARMEQVKDKKDERQKIREHNLNARKQGGSIGANLSKSKIVTPEDTGRKLSRAGFEGRKQDFLNSDKKKKSSQQ